MKYLLPALLPLAPISAFAGSFSPAEPLVPAATDASTWTVRTALYGWAQALDGDVAVRGISVPVDAGFDDILDNLDMAAMGMVEVSRERWSFMADLNYARIGSKNMVGPLVNDVESTQFLGNFTVAFDLVRSGGTSLDVYGGARVNWTELELDMHGTGPAGVSLRRSQDKTWVDPIVGLRFQSELSDRWFFRAVGDIGGFGSASDLTWQAMAGFGWWVSEGGSLLAGYRGIGTDYSDGGFSYEVVAHGPVIGFEYRF
ncbi:MAG: hypothetical protein EOP88_07155 [Verrucomicrobiaceae bacterium]|nr:MAG: hypothetical protein EOP88_07155 [Verrucomicrobiaceae bacterium]